jgi:Mg-chelatase subunit ChlD
MQESKALARWLRDLTATYHNEGDKVDVELTDPREGSYAARDGSHIGINPAVEETFGVDVERPNQLRVISDTTSHEVEHVNESVLTHKADFADEYPMAADAAGMVQNVLEDTYIDRTRTERFRGLRRAHAFKIDTIMANDEARPPMEECNRGQAFVEGFLQVAFAGGAKGDVTAHEDLEEWLEWVKPMIDRCRHTDNPAGRYEISHKVMVKLLTYLPEEEARKQANEAADSAADGNTTDKTGDTSGDAEDWSKEEVEEHLKSLTKEDVEDMDGGEGGQTIDPDELDVDEDELDFDWEDLPEGEGGGGGPDTAEEDESDEGDGGDAGEEDEDGDESDDTTGGDEDGEDGNEDTEEDGDGEDGNEDTEEDGDGEDTSGEEDDAEDVSNKSGDETAPGELENSGGDHGRGDELDEDVEFAGRSGEWHGLTQEEDYESPGEQWERRAEAIDREAMEGQTDLGQLKHERHERMAEAQDFGRQNSHRVREILRDEDTAQELIDAFRRLRTRDVKVPVTSGEEIHLKNAIQHLAGDYTVEQVYQRTRRIETGDRALAVSCDLSGSMRLMSALTALGACYICTREIGDDFAAVGFHGGNNTPLIKAFDETWEWELVDGVTAGGSTPMPAGIDTALNLFDGVRGKERVLIVITDGMANTSLDGGDPAEESASLVTTAQQEGVKVIGLGVGGVNEEYMRRIFGSDGYVLADSHKLAEALIEIYYRQMDLVKEGVV